MTDDASDEASGHTRRDVLASVGGAAWAPFGLGAAYRADRRFADRDDDGIPDDRKRSAKLHERLDRLFEGFDGLRVGRTDFLLDVRYVGNASVDDAVKRLIENRFRDNGIHAQWLDYRSRYDADRFEREYGYNVRETMWARDSFYYEEIEEELRDVAFQLVIVPGKRNPPHQGRVYSPWSDRVVDDWWDGWVNGMNVGNRAIVGARDDRREQARLTFHEIAHLALCHGDHTNPGVMGTGQKLDLTDDEWQSLRENLDNVRDTTGYDVAFRRCLLLEQGSYLCRGCV